MVKTEETSRSTKKQGESEAKWAAIVDDRLSPMPRRCLKASDILHQSGAKPGLILVRDFNSPNDIGFEADASVDLADGNVFRAVSGCERSHKISGDAPPKLAFIVDDRWEVTIQPNQSGKTLRGLLDVPADAALLRDFESPRDEPIKENEKIEFKDGPVFITGDCTEKAITIIVEGTPHEWKKPKITFVEVVTLFDPNFPQHPEITYSVTYKRGPAHNPEGILTPGASVKVIDEMVFNVSQTGQS